METIEQIKNLLPDLDEAGFNYLVKSLDTASTIRRWMREYDITTEQFCKELNINSEQFLSLISGKENYSIRTIAKIEALFDKLYLKDANKHELIKVLHKDEIDVPDRQG